MYFERSKEGNPLFSKIHPLLAGVLQTAALDPWKRYTAGSVRLLPSPGEDAELCRDWRDFVQPGLRLHFGEDRAIVAADIAAMKQGSGKNPHWSLEIPRAHSDAWLTTLNAQRLAMVAEYSLTEQELAAKGMPNLSNERSIALMQVRFFAFIQECLVQVLLSDTAVPDPDQAPRSE